MKQLLFSYIIILFFTSFHKSGKTSWIRINQLGYTPKGIKVAVWCSKEQQAIDNLPAGRQGWQLIIYAQQRNDLKITGAAVYNL